MWPLKTNNYVKDYKYSTESEMVLNNQTYMYAVHTKVQTLEVPF